MHQIFMNKTSLNIGKFDYFHIPISDSYFSYMLNIHILWPFLSGFPHPKLPSLNKYLEWELVDYLSSKSLCGNIPTRKGITLSDSLAPTYSSW